jgi:hypothetical protein
MRATCLVALGALAAIVPLASGGAGADVQVATSGPRVALALPPGLNGAEHAALERADAYGAHPVRFLMVGDSIALTLGMGLSVDAEAGYGVTIDNNATLGCDLDSQLQILNEGVPSPGVQGCGQWRGLWPFLVARLRPQVVALGLGRWEVTNHLLNGQWVHIGEPAWDTRLRGDLAQAISILHSFGARVVLFTMPYIDPSQRQADGMPYDEATPARARAYNAVVRQVARKEPNVVTVIDLNHMLAPAGVYATSLDGIDVRSTDGVHISPAGGELLQREILPQIARLGLKAEADHMRTTSAGAGTRKQG